MSYIARRRLKIGHDEDTDTPVFREIGDAVPEAETWPWQTRERYLAEGYLTVASESLTDQSAPAPKRAARGKTHG
jgi:hypothetical protein